MITRTPTLALPTPEQMDRVEGKKYFFRRGSIVRPNTLIKKGAQHNEREDHPDIPHTLRASR
jgi:hypothetical protein